MPHSGHFALRDAVHFSKLVHKVFLVMEAAGGVADQHVNALRPCAATRVEKDSRGIGSFGLALLMFGWPDISPEWRVLLFTGLFGAFTTMSTFTAETVTMLYDGRIGGAVLNFVLNPCVCICGAVAGRYAALLM